MHRPPHSAARGCALLLALMTSAGMSQPFAGKDAKNPPAVRWDEARPGCTFSRSEDGKYRYGLWAGEVGITLAVDSQEVEKVHRRHEPFFGVWLAVRNRGKDALALNPRQISLEFVSHFKVVQTALEPDGFSAQVQEDADQVDRETAREIEKHPERKASKEAYVRSFQKDSAELVEFISKSSLRESQLDPGSPEASGWVLFSTKNKWIGGWKKQEEFILRLPLAGEIFEFPFKLPPKAGELLLRRRD